MHPSRLARMACRLFRTTSSMATACGLQMLLDMVGPLRVLLAIVAGALGKLLRIPGMFYRVAGVQSRTCDDVTGTLPPYDQFLVGGPVRTNQVAAAIKAHTGEAQDAAAL